jgi:hypothetical protein
MFYYGKQVYAEHLKRHYQVPLSCGDICGEKKYLTAEIAKIFRSLGFIYDCLTPIKNPIHT